MKKLIYIDDDLDALELYRDILEDHFEITTCSEPDKGIEEVKKEKFDAILLDIYFPGTTGFDIMMQLKSVPYVRNIPLFFISSENTLHNRLKAFDMGSEDFISRYMEPEEVISRIRQKVEKYSNLKEPEPSLLNVGDIELDQDNLIVKCRDQIISLTQIEYKIIYILIKQFLTQESLILGKDELIQFVWPLDPESVFPRTLSTHLTNLRKKLDSQLVKIVSVRQNGFRLKVK